MILVLQFSPCCFSHLAGEIMSSTSRLRKAAILHMSKLNQSATVQGCNNKAALQHTSRLHQPVILQPTDATPFTNNKATTSTNLISFLAVNMINFVTHNTYVPFHS
ncbi:hypothetical protein KP509_32G051900 [Ceratopteris richardii]|uniref:Uncharacterized protein n=1 Tax=Ceratopteris richardii TaxID=49495 RepID=A0A8T2QUT7_CERRI|nr:hypothetical protein KP509_32G051800 [Ceratopteris richardii]KAH7287370.1 hypothetical protein KP509_32G051900 [Ceratopteris richardii]